MPEYRSEQQTLQQLAECMLGVQRGAKISIRTQHGDGALGVIEAVVPKIEQLHVLVDGASDAGATVFMRSLASAANLMTLGFRPADFGSTALYAFSLIAERLRRLRTLMIYAPMSENQACILARVIKTLPGLRQITLGGFGEGEDTFSMHIMVQAASMSTHMPKTVTIAMCSGASCQTAVLALVAQSVNRNGGYVRCPSTGANLSRSSLNTSLVRLEFLECGVGDDFAKILSDALAYDATIIALRIHGAKSDISTIGTMHLISGIRRHPAMREISLCGAFDDATARTLAHVLNDHNGVAECTVYSPGIAETTKQILAQIAKVRVISDEGGA